jgi:hypothetical protein
MIPDIERHPVRRPSRQAKDPGMHYLRLPKDEAIAVTSGRQTFLHCPEDRLKEGDTVHVMSEDARLQAYFRIGLVARFADDCYIASLHCVKSRTV